MPKLTDERLVALRAQLLSIAQAQFGEGHDLVAEATKMEEYVMADVGEIQINGSIELNLTDIAQTAREASQSATGAAVSASAASSIASHAQSSSRGGSSLLYETDMEMMVRTKKELQVVGDLLDAAKVTEGTAAERVRQLTERFDTIKSECSGAFKRWQRTL